MNATGKANANGYKDHALEPLASRGLGLAPQLRSVLNGVTWGLEKNGPKVHGCSWGLLVVTPQENPNLSFRPFCSRPRVTPVKTPRDPPSYKLISLLIGTP